MRSRLDGRSRLDEARCRCASGTRSSAARPVIASASDHPDVRWRGPRCPPARRSASHRAYSRSPVPVQDCSSGSEPGGDDPDVAGGDGGDRVASPSRPSVPRPTCLDHRPRLAVPVFEQRRPRRSLPLVARSSGRPRIGGRHAATSEHPVEAPLWTEAHLDRSNARSAVSDPGSAQTRPCPRPTRPATNAPPPRAARRS